MILKHNIHVLVLFPVMLEGFNLRIPESHKVAGDKCLKLAQEPYFNNNLVVGKNWRIYYAWNVAKNADYECRDIRFKNVTSSIINRIWNDMYEYLENQPSWASATLLMFMTPRHELLLFPDETIPGSFTGVANVVRSHNIKPIKKSVPLFKVQMKIIARGQYLVVSECTHGITTMSLRIDWVPYRGEMAVLGVANSMDFGDGNMVCPLDVQNPLIFKTQQIKSLNNENLNQN